MEMMNDVFKKIRGLIIFTAIVILVMFNPDVAVSVVSYVFGIFLPFLIGGAVAFILNVPMNFLERKIFSEKRMAKKPKLAKAARPLSLVMTIVLLIVTLFVVLSVLVPQLIDSFNGLIKSAEVFVVETQDFAMNLFKENKEIQDMLMSLKFDWESIVDFAIGFVQAGMTSVLDTTVSAASDVFSGITTGFVAFVFAVYILLQKEKLSIHCKKVIYAFLQKGRAGAVLEVLSLTYKTFANFLAGQCLEAVILGTMFIIVLTVFGIPFAPLIGIIIAVTALIPMFGAFIGLFFGAFFIFIESPIQALYFIIIFLVLQQVEGNFIYPYVVGNSVGLPSIWVLAAVSIGGSLMGVVGMLIFIPIVSVAYALFREVVYLKLKKNKINPIDIDNNKL